jgi:hypothetical protein
MVGVKPGMIHVRNEYGHARDKKKHVLELAGNRTGKNNTVKA